MESPSRSLRHQYLLLSSRTTLPLRRVAPHSSQRRRRSRLKDFLLRRISTRLVLLPPPTRRTRVLLPSNLSLRQSLPRSPTSTHTHHRKNQSLRFTNSHNLHLTLPRLLPLQRPTNPSSYIVHPTRVSSPPRSMFGNVLSVLTLPSLVLLPSRTCSPFLLRHQRARSRRLRLCGPPPLAASRRTRPRNSASPT